ncbi:MAG: molybdate ABC transporter substrate-binding protein [Alphaproteobacteria bacterium]
MTTLGRVLALLALVVTVSAAGSPARAERVTIFAAASLTMALTAALARFAHSDDARAVPVFAASSTLARQIAAGAPADLYLSAHPSWMAYLDERGRIETGTRVDLLTNRLALIAPRDAPLDLVIAPGFALRRALGDGRLAIADPSHVPAGIYARSALISLGAWNAVAGHIAAAWDVRATLALVERGEAPAGIVYESDARASKRIAVAGLFPADSHPPIRYPLAILSGRAHPAARRLHAFLLGQEAAAIFAVHGFARVR